MQLVKILKIMLKNGINQSKFNGYIRTFQLEKNVKCNGDGSDKATLLMAVLTGKLRNSTSENLSKENHPKYVQML